MNNAIFGRTWEEIRIMQQGGSTSRAIDFGPAPEATTGDINLLNECGVSGLEQKRFYGVLDRLKTSGLISGYKVI